MLNYKSIITNVINNSLSEHNINMDYSDYNIEVPPQSDMGDYAFPCFQLAKVLKKAPPLIAKEVLPKIQSALPKEFCKAEIKGPYINFFLDRTKFINDTYKSIIDKNYANVSQHGQGKTVLVDFSSPNIAKPFSIGHLRSTSIGNSLYQIHKYLGYNVVGINHLGDWGTQFGKMISAYKRWGENIDTSSNKIKECYNIYVRFHKEADKDPSLEDEARKYFRLLEDKDTEIVKLWEYFCNITLNEIKSIYKKLNVDFDCYTGESFYNEMLPCVVKELNEKKLLIESENAFIVDLDDVKLPPALIKKRDGATLYMTRDLAAALYRKKTFNFDKSLYVVAHQQNVHFKQLFKVIELMGYDWHKQMLHVNFGLLHIKGKMGSTREGNVIFLEDVINEVKSMSLKRLEESETSSLLSSEELNKHAEQLAISAILFNDLKHNRINDIDFDWDEILNTKGETGVYLQYNNARLYGIMRNYKKTFNHFPDNLIQITEDISFNVAKMLQAFNEKVILSEQQLEPSIISRYLLDLAKEFSIFYTENRVIIKDNPQLSHQRLLTVLCVKEILGLGLSLLGIVPMERV